jgi:hypothetical protein
MYSKRCCKILPRTTQRNAVQRKENSARIGFAFGPASLASTYAMPQGLLLGTSACMMRNSCQLPGCCALSCCFGGIFIGSSRCLFPVDIRTQLFDDCDRGACLVFLMLDMISIMQFTLVRPVDHDSRQQRRANTDMQVSRPPALDMYT